MSRSLKTLPLALFALALMAFGPGALSAYGQDRETHIISAKAGGVNFVAGDVSVMRKGETAWRELTLKDNLEAGDVVRTGSTGRAEVLLNPGSYVRLGENSLFTFVSVTLGDLRIKLGSGSAVIEAVTYDGADPGIEIQTPQTYAWIIRGGLYRIDVLQGNVTEVRVREGRAMVGVAPGTLVRGGHLARVSAGGTDLAKFDKKLRDELDEWSRERGKSLAKANQNLRRRTVNTMLASYTQNDIFSNGFLNNSTYSRPSGAWVYIAESRCYTFVPFYGGFNSPYGHGYPNMLGWAGPGPVCRGCQNNQPGNPVPVVVGNNGNGNLAGNGNGNGNGIGNGTGNGNSSVPGISNPLPSLPSPPPREVSRPEPASRPMPLNDGPGRMEKRDN